MPEAEMQNVPKIVSERLRAAPATDHPEADVLTAFTERALADRERAVVLEHLAACGDCRDIVALALPATESVPPLISPVRRGWFAWAALRWGLAAAGVILVASFGVIEYQRHAQGRSTVARFVEPAAEIPAHPPEARSPVAAPKPESEQKQSGSAPPANPSAPAVAGIPPAADRARISNPKPSEPTLTASLPAAGDRSRGSAGGAVGAVALDHPPIAPGLNLPTQWQQQPPRPAASGRAFRSGSPAKSQKQPPLPGREIPPAEPVTVEAEVATAAGASPQFDANAAQPAPLEPGQAAGSQPAAQTANRGPAAAEQTSTIVVDEQSDLVSKAKLATTLRAAGTRNVPHFAIGSSGALQRSFDQGKTWQDVDVTANPASLAERYSFASSETVARAKEKDSAADKKVPAPVSKVVFRAVAVNGSDVWAGGSNAALYHSLDAGDRWAQILPTAAGTSLTGDIISLEFADAGQGRVHTSTGETWTTSDNGQTWKKR